MDLTRDRGATLARRAAALAELFTAIARTRMAGMPVLNPALRVEALGFEPFVQDVADTASGLGILVTPWFMNLVCLPLQRVESAAAVGRARTLVLREQRFEFIGAHEPAIGAFAACSLFSPMFEFTHHSAAQVTAMAVLAQLRVEPVPARRSFLFGRSAAGAARP